MVLVGTWWYWVSIIWYCLVLSGTGLLQGFYACIIYSVYTIYTIIYIEQSGDLVGCHGSLTHSQTLKVTATELLIKYWSGALLSQFKRETLVKGKGDPGQCHAQHRDPAHREYLLSV